MGIPTGWIGAVADQRGEVIARSLSERTTQGQDAEQSLRAASAASTGGFYWGKSLEVVPIDVVFRTLPKAAIWSVHLVGVAISLALATMLTLAT